MIQSDLRQLLLIRFELLNLLHPSCHPAIESVISHLGIALVHLSIKLPSQKKKKQEVEE